MTEDEMVGWHHQFNGHELGQILGDGAGQDREAWHAAAHGVASSQTRLATEQIPYSLEMCLHSLLSRNFIW